MLEQFAIYSTALILMIFVCLSSFSEDTLSEEVNNNLNEANHNSPYKSNEGVESLNINLYNSIFQRHQAGRSFDGLETISKETEPGSIVQMKEFDTFSYKKDLLNYHDS